jgi:PAS domain S-box-containing protein
MYTKNPIQTGPPAPDGQPDSFSGSGGADPPLGSSVAALADGRERIDILAALQQKTLALEAEVARRQLLEDHLCRREAELADFFENAAECLHQVGPDGTIMWANKAEMTLLGYEDHEYIGHNITEFHADQATITDILRRLLQGETLHNYPARLRCKDGSIRDVLIHSNVRWEDGVFSYTRCFTRDITERKRWEAELDRRVEVRTRELVESQRNLRKLAAELSLAEGRVRKTLAAELHDYLAQLLIVTRLKLGQATQEAAAHPKLQQLLEGADGVLNEAITYTRSLMAELNPPILGWGLPMGLKWLADKFKAHHIEVELDIPEGLELQLSENQSGLLFQCTRELLMNVVKHANTGRAKITLTRDADSVSLHVSDKGKGFGPAAIPATVPTDQSLTQFGLFSIRERMEALGGRFDVRSGPNQGTRASLTLPLAEMHDPLPREPIRETPVILAGMKAQSADAILRVLLVDDHAMMREGLRGVLEGYADIQVVGEAADGQEAIAQAETLNPDVVVMDINLPRINGIEATRQIKSRNPRAIIIGLSVHQASQVESALKEAGGSAYVTKDSAAASLYEAIQKAVRQSRMPIVASPPDP